MGNKTLAKISSAIIQFGAMFWLLSTITFLIIDGWHTKPIRALEEITDYISVIFIFFGALLHLIARNQKILDGEYVKIWISSEKLPEYKGRHGCFMEFPVTGIPNVHDIIEVQHPDDPELRISLRIIKREYVTINNKMIALSLRCLV